MESSGRDGGKDQPGGEDAGAKGVDGASGGGRDAVADDAATEAVTAEGEDQAEDKAEDKAEEKAEDKAEEKAEAAEKESKDAAKDAAGAAAESAGKGADKGKADKGKAVAGDGSGGRDSKKFRNAAIVGGALIVAGFATGFAGGFISGPGIGTESGEPRTLEQLAAATGCKPVISSNKDFRQGNCQTKRGRFVLVAFTTEKSKQTWLKLAKDYGGVFLVGTRWVIAGTGPDNVTKPMLNEFRDDLGGQIQPGRKHHGGGGDNPHGPK